MNSARRELTIQLQKFRMRPIPRFAQTGRPTIGQLFAPAIRTEGAFGGLGQEFAQPTNATLTTTTDGVQRNLNIVGAGVTSAGAIPITDAEWLDPELHLTETQMRTRTASELEQLLQRLGVFAMRLNDQIREGTPTGYDKAKRLSHVDSQIKLAHAVANEMEIKEATAFVTDAEWADPRNSLRKFDMQKLGKDEFNGLLTHYGMIRRKLTEEKTVLETAIQKIEARFRLRSKEVERLNVVLGRIDHLDNQTRAAKEVLSDRKKIADDAKAQADALAAENLQAELDRQAAERNEQGQEGLPAESRGDIPKWVWGLGAGILVLGVAYVVIK